MTAMMAFELPAPPPLAQVSRPALFLDLDGTLADIEPHPQDVKPEPWRSRLLRRLDERLDGRVAVISGRTLEDLDRILEGSVTAAAGVHGLVRRRPNGSIERAPPHPGLDPARAEAEALAAEHPRLLIEDKGLSLAIHYRGAPDLGPVVVSTAMRMAGACALKLQLGDMVAEIVTPGFDKGAAVRAFMTEAPFRGAVPIFVGDDLTDEDAFKAAQAAGGLGVLAGPRRATAAHHHLPGVEAVRRWLEALLAEGVRR